MCKTVIRRLRRASHRSRSEEKKDGKTSFCGSKEADRRSASSESYLPGDFGFRRGVRRPESHDRDVTNCPGVGDETDRQRVLNCCVHPPLQKIFVPLEKHQDPRASVPRSAVTGNQSDFFPKNFLNPANLCDEYHV
jgi:hypothetical protein